MSDTDKVWFPRFGDIPGVQWDCPPGIDRTSLRGHDAQPHGNEWDTDWLSWPILYEREEGTGLSVSLRVDAGADTNALDEDRDGSTSSSPAGQYPGFTGPRTMAEQLQRLAEALELPGQPGDYHHLISEAAGYLFKIRLRESGAIGECNRLCHLDVQLLRACPSILERERRFPDEDDMPVWIETLRLLHRLHQDNGDLIEAEQVAVMAEQEFGQRFEPLLGQTRERLALLRSEDA